MEQHPALRHREGDAISNGLIIRQPKSPESIVQLQHRQEALAIEGVQWSRHDHGSLRRNQRLVGWPLQKPSKKSEGNDNIVEFAPSVAEADAILAKFGYAERELAAA